jgi:hypothetical protein
MNKIIFPAISNKAIPNNNILVSINLKSVPLSIIGK